MPSKVSLRASMREDIRELFHQYFDLLAVLKTFALAAQFDQKRLQSDREAANELQLITTALVDRAESIRTRVFNLVG